MLRHAKRATTARTKGTTPARLRAAKHAAAASLRIRLRVYVGEEIAIGPGKAQLLEQIARTGSILGAARSLEMSYMRAWTLVRTMNHCFEKPLVRTARGGSQGGRAVLTSHGKEILALYVDMTEKSHRAATPSWRKLRAKLASSRYT